MRTVVTLLCLALCVGCRVSREARTCVVVEQDTYRPIAGAKVWIQPAAPHPFWPRSDSGVTDASGQTELSLPTDYWWWWTHVTAASYSQADDHPYDKLPNGKSCWTFYMRPDRPSATRPAR